HTTAEIEALLKRMRAAALIGQLAYGADGERYDVFGAARALPHLRGAYTLLAGDGDPPIEGRFRHHGRSAPINTDPNRVVYLAFTSGTTGEPKGVMHSDNTLLANARALAGDWRLDSNSVIYTLSPLSHNLGLGALITALAVGGELVVHDLPRGASLLDRLI